MKIITTTIARKTIGNLLNRVKYAGEVFGIGRRNSIEALLIQFPDSYREDVNDITNINADSRSFEFLSKEKDIYSYSDLRNKNA